MPQSIIQYTAISMISTVRCELCFFFQKRERVCASNVSPTLHVLLYKLNSASASRAPAYQASASNLLAYCSPNQPSCFVTYSCYCNAFCADAADLFSSALLVRASVHRSQNMCARSKTLPCKFTLLWRYGSGWLQLQLAVATASHSFLWQFMIQHWSRTETTLCEADAPINAAPPGRQNKWILSS
jgi:hypothetical protein